MAWSLAELADLLGVVVGDSPGFTVRRPVPADSDDPEGLTFCASAKYVRVLAAHRAGAVIVPPGLAVARPYLVADDPRAAFETFLGMCRRPLPVRPGVHPTAVIDSAAEVHSTASIGPYVVVERGARIGAGARVFPHCYVGEDCVVGENTILYPHVVLYQDVAVGARCVVHAHAVLGRTGSGSGGMGSLSGRSSRSVRLSSGTTWRSVPGARSIGRRLERQKWATA